MNLIAPFVIGGVLTLLLNIPLCAVEDRLPGSGKLRRILSLACVLSLLFAVLALLLALVLPQLAVSVRALGGSLPFLWDEMRLWLSGIAQKFPVMKPILNELLQTRFPELLQNGLAALPQQKTIFGGAVNFAAAVFSQTADFLIGLVLATYLLARKEQLLHEAKQLMRAWLSPQSVLRLQEFFSLCSEIFSGFISGQCLEACILGGIFAAAMSVCRFPYVTLISVVIGFTALVPVFGAFVGCGVGILVILTEQPQKAGWFLVLFLCIQQIEGNLIYPRVVGGKVGLPPMWVLIAVTLGGRLFGVVGMLAMIPLFGVLYTLLRRSTAERLKTKKERDKNGGV